MTPDQLKALCRMSALRHVQLMAEGLKSGGYPMLTDEPEHCADSMLTTVAALWEARTALAQAVADTARECADIIDNVTDDDWSYYRQGDISDRIRAKFPGAFEGEKS